MLALPIFPGRLQPSIVGRSELNFRVRDGNGWTLALISTNYLLYLHPENRTMYLMRWEKADCLQNFVGQALGLLVPVSCIHYCTSTSDLSTLLSSRGLTTLTVGISYLEASFTLRCFQRLSRPYLATQLCPWQNNWCTRGTSIPVLSY